MAYNKTNWNNGTAPYMNADNLNNIENQNVLIDNVCGTYNIIIYDNTQTYNKNDYCIYNNILYVANQDIETAEEFNIEHWDRINLLNINKNELPIGSGMDYYGTIAPENYMFADGSAISREEYAELFEIIGITYGSGDGSTTFNLPDKRERVSVMYKSDSTMGTTGATFDTIGAKGGEDKHTLSIAEMPAHNHTYGKGNEANVGSLYGWFPVDDKTGSYATNNTGGGEAHNILQPYIVCNYIIKVK